jgi:hypothetical protein
MKPGENGRSLVGSNSSGPRSDQRIAGSGVKLAGTDFVSSQLRPKGANPMMPTIKLTIERRFDNGEKGESNDSPLAWELHSKRSQILHEELEMDPAWTVASLGETDDAKRTREDLTVLLELAEGAKTVALGFAGTVLYKVLEDSLVDAVKSLLRGSYCAFARRK